MNKRVLALAAVIATCTSILPATASAAFTRKAVTFDLEIKGTQTVKWNTSHAKQFECDVDITGSGTEKWRFATAKPVRVTLMKVNRIDPIFTMTNPSFMTSGIPLRSTITRAGDIVTTGGKVCSYGDGTGGETAERAKDCGTRRTKAIKVEVAYDTRQKDLLELQRSHTEAPEPFANCPDGGITAPRLLTYKGHNDEAQDIGRKLPAADLFDPAWKKHIVLAGGTFKEDYTETSSTTTVRWELTLTRVGAKNPGR